MVKETASKKEKEEKMKGKLFTIGFLLLLLLPLVSAEEGVVEESVFDRIVSKDKDPDNGICDDGENFILDDDCTFSFQLLAKGEIFEYMWFLRLMLLLTILLIYFQKTDYYAFSLVVTSALLVYHGLFGISQPPNPSNTYSITSLGNTIFPNSPVLGWIMVGLLFIFVYRFVHMETE